MDSCLALARIIELLAQSYVHNNREQIHVICINLGRTLGQDRFDENLPADQVSDNKRAKCRFRPVFLVINRDGNCLHFLP